MQTFTDVEYTYVFYKCSLCRSVHVIGLDVPLFQVHVHVATQMALLDRMSTEIASQNVHVTILRNYCHCAVINYFYPLSNILIPRGATPPLPQYAFMVWCSVKVHGQLYLVLHYQGAESFLRS